MMQKLKKFGLFLMGIMIFFGFNIQYSRGLGNGKPKLPEMNTDSTTTLDGEPTKNIDQGSHGISEKLKGILQLPEPGNYNTGLGYVMALIQITMNWLLGMLALVALIYMIYCGFLVVSSGSDEKNASKGKKGIRNAAIALAGIGISRLIVSAIIRFIFTMADKGMSM